MKLSIIILNYNVRHFLELCLKSVESAIKNLDAEIIVVDNDSEDDSCQMVKDLFPQVTLIENKKNLGFSKGNNVGVSKAKGEYLCILNPDTVVAEDTFEKLLEFAESKTILGAIGCKLINGGGLFLPESKRNIPYLRAAVKKIFGNPSEYYANHIGQDEIGKIDILVGAFMFLKRQVYNEVRGFDEDYFMYGEDIDLSYRILRAGYANYYYGAITAIHFKGESTLKDKSYAKRFFGAMQIFYTKHFKTNVLFDLFVWLGIKMAYVFRKIKPEKIKNVSAYVFVSDKMDQRITDVLSGPIHLQNQLESNFESEVEVIFNGNKFSYKIIIETMERNFKKNKQLTYKILPNGSSFLVGSDDGFSRGEVIMLE
ncbi:glycosyltransferase family 2 protein [Flavobacteriaceae bacterium SZ-1-7]|uniref:glycosyltransferase family 2 protein n=1 Tax=Tamlana sedimenti TaxID=3134126 RepID=UPI003121FA26